MMGEVSLEPKRKRYMGLFVFNPLWRRSHFLLNFRQRFMHDFFGIVLCIIACHSFCTSTTTYFFIFIFSQSRFYLNFVLHCLFVFVTFLCFCPSVSVVDPLFPFCAGFQHFPVFSSPFLLSSYALSSTPPPLIFFIFFLPSSLCLFISRAINPFWWCASQAWPSCNVLSWFIPLLSSSLVSETLTLKY